VKGHKTLLSGGKGGVADPVQKREGERGQDLSVLSQGKKRGKRKAPCVTPSPGLGGRERMLIPHSPNLLRLLEKKKKKKREKEVPISFCIAGRRRGKRRGEPQNVSVIRPWQGEKGKGEGGNPLRITGGRGGTCTVNQTLTRF